MEFLVVQKYVQLQQMNTAQRKKEKLPRYTQMRATTYRSLEP